MKNIDGYLRRVNEIFQTAYSDGYADGFEKAKEEYAHHSRGIAHCHRATKEEVEKYGFELHGWCDCGKPIIGRWAGLANFCPWCGRVIEWEKDKTE